MSLRGAGGLALALALLALPAARALAAPAPPLLLTDVQIAQASSSAATLSWKAARATDAYVELGRTAPYGAWFPASRGPDGRYTVSLSALSPSTTYQFRITARARVGAAETSGTLTTAAIPPRTRAATRDQRILLDGQPFFPIMAWGQCPETYAPLLSLGVNLFVGACTGRSGQSLLDALAGRAYSALPVSDVGAEGPGLIGWNFQDEPEGFGVPSSHLPDVRPVAETGRLRFLTLTNHFYSAAQAIAPERPKDIYPGYFAKADVIGFDLYPLQKFCGNEWLGLGDVFGAGLELSTQHVPDKPTYQWIETGPLEGECWWAPPLSPAALRAEVWMAIAGGAAGIGYFTHTFVGPEWLRFDVAADLQAEMLRTNREIGELAPALLGPTEDAAPRPGAPVVVGARSLNGAVYVIAVNPTGTATEAGLIVPALGTRTVSVFGEGRALRARRGELTDHFGPLAVHVYVAPPR